jgi:hypothetical protein
MSGYFLRPTCTALADRTEAAVRAVALGLLSN